MKKIILTLSVIALTFLVKSNTVQAQSCTTTPPTNTGTSTLSTTTTAGTYRVWSRMKAADTTNNSFYIRFDSGCAILVGDSSNISTSTWTWVDYQNNNSASKIDVTLTAGNHVVTIIGNEPGVSVDKILLTKNLTCVPVNLGDNCPAETPTSTPTPTPADTTLPLITNIVVGNITNTGSTISWNLSEPATGQVEYGTTQNYGLTSIIENNLLSFHSQILNGLTPGTLYHYRIRSKDAAGNTALTPDKTFTTTGGASPTIIPTNIPTNIPTTIPTAPITAAPLETILKFSTIKLHGIGTGGDNTDPNISGNASPNTQTRSLTVELYDPTETFVTSTQGNIVYSSTVGYFSGDIKLDSTVTAGDYLIKIKADKYLRRKLNGIITITKGTTIQMPEATLITGDSNGDGVLSILDYNIIIDCYSDLLPAKNCTDPAKKLKADISDDGKVNHDDYTLLLRELSVVTGD